MLSVRRILCPIDFSDASSHAIDQARVIAGWYQARITALHVYHGTTGTGDAEVERLRGEVMRVFRAAASAGLAVEALVQSGPAVGHILETAANLPADLIVMGTHGAGGFERLVLGSVAEKVLRQARCPVLTVPPRAQATSALPFKHVLCPVDFSESSIDALQFALSLAQESDASLPLLHVLEWPWEEPPAPVFEELPPDQALKLAEFRRFREQQAAEKLAALVPSSVREWCTPVTRVAHGKSHVEILRAAA